MKTEYIDYYELMEMMENLNKEKFETKSADVSFLDSALLFGMVASMNMTSRLILSELTGIENLKDSKELYNYLSKHLDMRKDDLGMKLAIAGAIEQGSGSSEVLLSKMLDS